jgi:TolB-like protein
MKLPNWKTRPGTLWRPVEDTAALVRLTATVSWEAKKTKAILYLLLGMAGLLIVLNVFARPEASQAALAARWWSAIPLLTFAVLAAILATRGLWLAPRALEAQRRLVTARPLHGPLAGARLVEEGVLRRLESLPTHRPDLEVTLAEGRDEAERMVQERFVKAPKEVEIKRRAARLDAYRIALGIPEIDAVLQPGFFESPTLARELAAAVALLKVPVEKEPKPTVAAREVPSAPPSIAVLPFADMSPQQDQEYFAHGLAEELINALTKIGELRVIARSSTFSFTGKDQDIREIGRRLNADAVLEGSVRKAGDRLRITAQLVNVADGFELWSSHFDREVEDVFAIQDELARSIVQALRVTLTAQEQRQIEKSPTRVVGAYDYYLRGRKFFSQYRSRGMEFALEMFSHAIELDADYALAHAGIADCCGFLYANAGQKREHLERALEASRKALELDAELPEAHVARGVALSYSGKDEEANEYFENALRLDPQLFEAHYFYARHHFVNDRPEKAIEFYGSASKVRPEDYQSLLLSVQIYEDLDRHEEADEIRRHGVEITQRHLMLNPDDTRALYFVANALVVLGRREDGLRMARRAREIEPTEPILLYNVACIYSLAGETDGAIDCLRAAIENGFAFPEWVEHDSNLDAVRDHPDFEALMAAFA